MPECVYASVPTPGAALVVEALAKMPQLTQLKLNLADNKLEAEGARTVGVLLGKLTQLTALELRLNKNEVRTAERSSHRTERSISALG